MVLKFYLLYFIFYIRRVLAFALYQKYSFIMFVVKSFEISLKNLYSLSPITQKIDMSTNLRINMMVYA